jgi:hypothetical protein
MVTALLTLIRNAFILEFLGPFKTRLSQQNDFLVALNMRRFIIMLVKSAWLMLIRNARFHSGVLGPIQDQTVKAE